jgi:hypothetical protein
MHSTNALSVLVGFVGFVGFVGAQTFVVDAANGPGANFTDVAAAVAAVPDGSTLIVRQGNYGAFDINGKGLTVLGGPGVIATSGFAFSSSQTFQVRNTSPAQSVVVRGFTCSDWLPQVSVQNCAGSVLFEDLQLDNANVPIVSPMPPAFLFGGCSQLILRNCTLRFGSLSNSNTVLEHCTLNGLSAVCAHTVACQDSFVALSVIGGTAQLVDCTVQGGNGFGQPFAFSRPNQPAISCFGAVRILAPSTIRAGVDPFGRMPPVPAIDGTGSLRIDPAVAILGAATPPIAATLSSLTAPMPAAIGTSAAPGGSISGSALGPAGNLTILLLGLPGAPLSAPGIADALWIDPNAYLFAGFGVPQPGAPVTVSVAVPNSPIYLGTRIAWQSVSAGAALEASNPTWSLVR